MTDFLVRPREKRRSVIAFFTDVRTRFGQRAEQHLTKATISVVGFAAPGALGTLAMLLAASLAIGTAIPAVQAQEAGARSLLLSADLVTYDPEDQRIQARGNVEVSRNNRVLKADHLTYDQRRNQLFAEGNVTLVEPTGEVVFASRMEISGDLETGIIEDLRLIFADGARLAAAGGNRRDGSVTDISRAVYSPCHLCPDDPERPPLWQVKAVRVRHDQSEKIVEFTDAWMEMGGIPVFYLPYFYQPDPTVKRKSGVLLPTFANSSDFGLVAQLPFFWAISPHQDITIVPWITTKENALLEVQYRQALTHGEIKLDSSITRDSQPQTRGHIFGRARYDIDETWRAGLDVRRALDRTYLRRYDFSNSETLTSRIFGEAFPSSSNYFSANSYLFQGLKRDDDNDELPFVAPKFNYYHLTGRDVFGGQTEFAVDSTTLTRREGNDTQRLSLRADWRRPMVGVVGDVYTFQASLWNDGYFVNDLARDGGNDRYTGFSGRIFPQVGMEWRLPLVRDGEAFQQVVEPILEAIYAPQFGNPSRIPNEDSQDFEFNDINVFGFSRYSGLDRVEKGPRLNYGLSWNLFRTEGGRASLFAGQSYRFFEDQDLPATSGVSGNISDLVTAVDIAPGDYVDLVYRNRIDVDEAEVRRHELRTRFGPRALRAGVAYVKYEGGKGSQFDGREELDFTLSSRLTRYWRTAISGVRELDNGGSQRELGMRLTYEDECFLFTIGYARKNFEDRDIEASDTVFVRLGFKTIGDIGAGF